MSSDWGKIFGSFKNWYIHFNIIIYEHRLSNKDKQDELWANAHYWKSMNIDEKNYSCNCYNTSALFQNRVKVRPVK
jgi:hypothetical protein